MIVNQDTRERDQRFNSEPSDSDEDLWPRLPPRRFIIPGESYPLIFPFISMAAAWLMQSHIPSTFNWTIITSQTMTPSLGNYHRNFVIDDYVFSIASS